MKGYSEILRFVLDDNIVEIDFSRQNNILPSTTVLKYLRSLDNHKGTKEGCGEGDCGACTVVIAEKGESGHLHYKAVDSCLLFLPAIHGKQLITVENLAEKRNGKTLLHPVQQAMVELNGSQCGYCTPGIVMSMFALYKNHPSPDTETIKNSLTGNLCRCTGYSPILAAAEKACSDGNHDRFTGKEPYILSLLDEINKLSSGLKLSSKELVYYRPVTLPEFFELLNHNSRAVLINGATDVALRQTKKHEKFQVIIDISGIEELKYFNKKDDSLVFGAGMSMEDIRIKVKDFIPEFYQLLNVFGSLQIRNVATPGGNIGSASPIGDSLPLMIALKAQLVLKSAENERTVPVESFITGYRTTILEPGEIIHRIIINIPDNDTVLKSYKVSKRKNLDISTVSGAFSLIRDKDGSVKEVILAFGGVAAMPVRAVNTEKFLVNKIWDESTVEKAASILKDEFRPISDARGSEEFRKTATANLLIKFYEDTRP